MSQIDTNYLPHLRRTLIKHLNLEELKEIVRRLDIPWDDLPGDRKTTKTYSLTMLLQQNGRFADLLAVLQQEKADLDWSHLLNDAVRQEAVQGYMEQVSDLLESYQGDDAHL